MIDTPRALCRRIEADNNNEGERTGSLEQCFDPGNVRVIAHRLLLLLVGVYILYVGSRECIRYSKDDDIYLLWISGLLIYR